MSEKKPMLGAGDVTITLAGEEFVLKPSLHAMMTISRTTGGIRGAIDGVARMEMDIIVRVVGLGIGQQQARRFKNDLAEVIYESGLTDATGGVIAKCIEYLHVLANGGKPVNTEEVAEDDSTHPA